MIIPLGLHGERKGGNGDGGGHSEGRRAKKTEDFKVNVKKKIKEQIGESVM